MMALLPKSPSHLANILWHHGRVLSPVPFWRRPMAHSIAENDIPVSAAPAPYRPALDRRTPERSSASVPEFRTVI